MIPEFNINLILISLLTNKGHSIISNKEYKIIGLNNNIITTVKKYNNLYILNINLNNKYIYNTILNSNILNL